MTNRVQTLLPAVGLSLLISACTAGAASSAGVGNAGRLPTPAQAGFDPRGLEAVLNKRDDQLVALFGVPRLDVIEDRARKLQFANNSCVLDVFLYPSGRDNAQDRRSNYVEARDRQGNDVEVKSCIAALRR